MDAVFDRKLEEVRVRVEKWKRDRQKESLRQLMEERRQMMREEWMDWSEGEDRSLERMWNRISGFDSELEVRAESRLEK